MRSRANSRTSSPAQWALPSEDRIDNTCNPYCRGIEGAKQAMEAQSANCLFFEEKAFSIPSPLTSIVVLKLLGSSTDTPPLIAHSLKVLSSDVSLLTS